MPKPKTDTPTLPKILSVTEMDAINLLCDLAVRPTNNQQQLTDKTKDSQNPPPVRLQNLALPARVAACRVVLAVANGVHYTDALAKYGLSHLEFTAMRLKDKDFFAVFEAAKRIRDMKTVANAQIGLDRLLTEDECGLNAKAVMFALERLNPQQFGRASEDGGEGGRGGAKTVYNIVINAQSGPTPCGNLAANHIEAEVINENPHE